MSLPIAAAGDMGVGEALLMYNKEQSTEKLQDRILFKAHEGNIDEPPLSTQLAHLVG